MRLFLLMLYFLFLESCTTVEITKEIIKAGNSVKTTVSEIVSDKEDDPKINEDTKLPVTEFIDSAASSIAKVIKQNDLIILRSTVTVGTSRKVFLKTLEKISGLKANSSSNGPLNLSTF